jgi:gamma-glutamyl-gamma-aminobutyrate hydrolase PuuD
MPLPKRRVFMVGNGDAFIKMFEPHNIIPVDNMKNADFFQFTGGEDVSPTLYGQTMHATTRNNITRDKKEAIVFNIAADMKKPMAGVCRGAQFLNVMCGGDMWQDVDSHAGVQHVIHDDMEECEYLANSTHHQMMEVGEEGVLIAYAGTSKVRSKHISGQPTIMKTIKPKDPEVVWYDKPVDCLCVQFHPEYPGWEKLAERYVNYINLYLFN